MLDDLKYIHQRDGQDALGVAERQAGHDLAAAGFGLRVRRIGKRRIQTLKGERSAVGGLFDSGARTPAGGFGHGDGEQADFASAQGHRRAAVDAEFEVQPARRGFQNIGTRGHGPAGDAARARLRQALHGPRAAGRARLRFRFPARAIVAFPSLVLPKDR